MCDTQLLVQGQSFNVHRAYLAACSQYFYSMFTKDFQEKSQNQVTDNPRVFSKHLNKHV